MALITTSSTFAEGGGGGDRLKEYSDKLADQRQHSAQAVSQKPEAQPAPVAIERKSDAVQGKISG